jgi:hypothetical protein
VALQRAHQKIVKENISIFVKTNNYEVQGVKTISRNKGFRF